MMTETDIAKLIFEKPDTARTATSIATGIALADSSGGRVRVQVDGTQVGGESGVWLDTTRSVSAGDRVIITCYGRERGRRAFVSGVMGESGGGGGGDLEERVAALESEVSDIEDDIATLESTTSSLSTRVTAVEGTVSSLSGTVSSLSSTVSGLTSDVSSLESSVSSLSTTVAGHTSSISSLQSDVSSLGTRMTTAEGTISTLSSDLSTLSGTVSSLSTTVAGHTSSISSLTSRVASVEGSISSLEGRMTTAEGTISSLSTTVAGHTSSISTLTSDVSSLTSSLSTLSGIVSGHTTQLGGMTIEWIKNGDTSKVTAGAWATRTLGINAIVIHNGTRGIIMGSFSASSNSTTPTTTWAINRIAVFSEWKYDTNAGAEAYCACRVVNASWANCSAVTRLGGAGALYWTFWSGASGTLPAGEMVTGNFIFPVERR